MILDWIAREGWIILAWWFLVTLAGATVLPLLTRLLGGLPDRGYTLARPAGMLLIGFVFWLLAILGLVRNSPGGAALAWLIVLSVSLTVYFTTREPLHWRAWWRENRTAVIVSELLFITLLVIWAIFRAYQHELRTTEKPMDLAFMSAIQQSATFPPHDPWLAGYNISYYYFGYVMAATMSTLVGVPSTIGLNMHVALLFALAGTTAFGIVYNLVRSRAFHLDRAAGRWILADKAPSQSIAASFGLLAMVFMVWLGNFQLPLVEIPYQTSQASAAYLHFWDTDGRRIPLDAAITPDGVDSWGYWWWFRASRAIDDRDLNGNHEEVIAEFPQFSFLLADSHPHMMALPFALLAIGLALNVLLAEQKPNQRQVLLYGLCVGALIFLNTWDTPIYLTLLVTADLLRRFTRNGRLHAVDWQAALTLVLALAAIAVIAYLPFIVGFRSQLQGILPNLLHPTRILQLFLHLGPFFLLLVPFLLLEIWRAERSGSLNWRLGFIVTGSVLSVLIVGLLALALIGWLSPGTRYSVLGYIDEHGGWDEILPTIFSRRMTNIMTPLTLFLLFVPVIGRLFPPRFSVFGGDAEDRAVTYPPATGFALVLIGAGILLVCIPDFMYLRDNFGTRMNTVFKFYYQSWAMFSVAGAYAAYAILADLQLERPHALARVGYATILTVVLAAGLLYPVLGMYHRMFAETGRVAGNSAPLTLDGGPSFVDADDYNALMCLRDLVGQADVVVVEANPESGPSGDDVNYNPTHGRVGALTGMPILIGWTGHESQWRGTGYNQAVGARKSDLDILYTDLRIDVAAEIIERYGIDYIMYGATERQHYHSGGEEKFIDNFAVVCESGDSRIYRTRPLSLPFLGQ